VLIYPDYEALCEQARKDGIAFAEHIDLEQLTADAKEEIVEKFKSLLEQEVRGCMEKLAPYQRVTRIMIERDEFVKTSTKKIKRFMYNGRMDILEIE